MFNSYCPMFVAGAAEKGFGLLLLFLLVLFCLVFHSCVFVLYMSLVVCVCTVWSFCCLPLGFWLTTLINNIWVVVIIIIIIIIIIISFMQGIHTYIPETNHVSRVYNAAAIPAVLLMVHITLSSILNSFVLLHWHFPQYVCCAQLLLLLLLLLLLC
jgi:hypothetical protein